MSRARCAGTARDGLPCWSPPASGSDFCRFHGPERPVTPVAGRARRPDRKYRQCPACSVVRVNGDFKTAVARYRASGAWARCPACGHVAMRLAFAEVEPPAEGEVGS